MRQRRGVWRTVVMITALAVLVGPQCCCCTLKTWASVPVDQAVAGGTCCCCESAASATAPSCPLERHPTGDDGCPCRANLRPVAAAVGGAGSISPLELSAWSGWQAAWAASWSLEIGPTVLPCRWPGPGETPRLSGRELLRALSTLRC